MVQRATSVFTIKSPAAVRKKKILCCAQPLLRDCRSVLKELMPFLEAAAGAAVGGIAKMSNLWFVPA